MTLAAINAPIETRLAQVVVNLERMRWMDRDLGARYLTVNIPDFTVRLVDGGRTTWQSKVVVGKTHVTETPEFSGVVSYMVVNPTWHIPDSIAIRDYLPKLQRDPMVLKRQNIRLLTRARHRDQPEAGRLHPVHAGELSVPHQAAAERTTMRSARSSSCSRTSIRSTCTTRRTASCFARDARAFSNGCIRLEKPVELAHILLTGQVDDPAAAFDGWVAAKSERQVTLERTIPVHIVYRTVWFDETGAARYRPDVYGRDAQVFEALEAAGVTLPAAQG